MAELSGRVVVVTGGTRGVGRAVVVRLASRGAQIVFQGRDASAAQETIARADGPEPVYVPGDLTSYDSISELCAQAVDRFGRLDGAVGSGLPGHSGASLFRDCKPDALLDAFVSGAMPRLSLAHAAAPHMARQSYGKIVFVTSDAGRVPTPAETMVGSAAAAIIYFTRAAGRELARDGIRINSVAVSLTKDTPGWDRVEQRRADGVDNALARAFAKIENGAAFGLGTASETAEAVSFFIGPESDGISGATVSLNRGGYFPAYA